MAFELYKFKGGKSKFGFPAIVLQASGGIGLNDKAYEAIGTPEYVQLYYDEDARRIGVKATVKTDSYGYPVRESGDRSFIVSARSFYSYYGINPEATARYRAELDGDMLVADLREPISPYRPRKKRQERQNGSTSPSDKMPRANNGIEQNEA